MVPYWPSSGYPQSSPVRIPQLVNSGVSRLLCKKSNKISYLKYNSPTVEFWQEKIKGNLRRANTKPSVDFRKANTDLSVHLRRANTETYQKYNINLSKIVRKDRVFLRLAGLLFGISLGQPCQPLENPVIPSSFSQICLIYSRQQEVDRDSY